MFHSLAFSSTGSCCSLWVCEQQHAQRSMLLRCPEDQVFSPRSSNGHNITCTSETESGLSSKQFLQFFSSDLIAKCNAIHHCLFPSTLVQVKAVVVGLDRSINYYKLQMAMAYIIKNDAHFVVGDVKLEHSL